MSFSGMNFKCQLLENEVLALKGFYMKFHLHSLVCLITSEMSKIFAPVNLI